MGSTKKNIYTADWAQLATATGDSRILLVELLTEVYLSFAEMGNLVVFDIEPCTEITECVEMTHCIIQL